MKAEIIIATGLAVVSCVGCAFVIITGIREAKRNRKNGPFKDRN
jgi:hypothetical protein